MRAGMGDGAGCWVVVGGKRVGNLGGWAGGADARVAMCGARGGAVGV